MEFVATLAALCVALSFLCASGNQVDIQKPDEHVHHAKFMLPRKLNHNAENTMKTLSYKEFIPHKKLIEEELPSGNKQQEKEENVMHSGASAKGTWREWVEEGPNKSEYFTMDYVWVRRRRPIHNKQIPNLP